MDSIIFINSTYGSRTTFMSSINIATSITALSMIGHLSFTIKLLASTFCLNVSLAMLMSFLTKPFQNYWTDEVPLGIRRKLWFKHDGAPVHYALNVRRYLDLQFPNRWICRNRVVSWPPRSADLSPLDFFLREPLRSFIYETLAESEEDLVARFTVAAR